MNKRKILFLCGANSCRSQMAEGWARHIAGDKWEIHSAGSRASFVQPRAVAVMKEAGIDISSQWSKSIKDVPVNEIDWVVTLCAEGVSFCPSVPGVLHQVHWPIEDPIAVFGNDAKVLDSFRAVRDDLRRRIEEFFKMQDIK